MLMLNYMWYLTLQMAGAEGGFLCSKSQCRTKSITQEGMMMSVKLYSNITLRFLHAVCYNPGIHVCSSPQHSFIFKLSCLDVRVQGHQSTSPMAMEIFRFNFGV